MWQLRCMWVAACANVSVTVKGNRMSDVLLGGRTFNWHGSDWKDEGSRQKRVYFVLSVYFLLLFFCT